LIREYFNKEFEKAFYNVEPENYPLNLDKYWDYFVDWLKWMNRHILDAKKKDVDRFINDWF